MKIAQNLRTILPFKRAYSVDQSPSQFFNIGFSYKRNHARFRTKHALRHLEYSCPSSKVEGITTGVELFCSWMSLGLQRSCKTWNLECWNPGILKTLALTDTGYDMRLKYTDSPTTVRIRKLL